MLNKLSAMAIVLSFSILASAQESNVIVEKQEDYTKSYKQRRTQHGALFSIGTESFYPLDYQSLLGDVFIENIIGSESIKLINIDIGYKHNFSIASASILFNFATGSIDGSVAPRTLALTKQGFSLNLALDAIMDEPWVVPYAQVGVHQFSISEESATASESATTGMSFNYRYGLLFQLDWIENAIDKNARTERLYSSGLENTYIDVYYIDHLAASDAQDSEVLGSDGSPNMLSSGEMGIGLKLEF